MRDPGNIQDIASLNPDYMGFIFYPHSPRYAGNLDPGIVQDLPGRICRVGVFVNEQASSVMKIADKYGLEALQLHGQESPEYCQSMRETGRIIIKVFPVGTTMDFQVINRYNKAVDFVLFDTATPGYGGSGKSFAWSILDAYRGEMPFFLSGGIDPESGSQISQNMQHPLLHAIDINSRFELKPGIKDKTAITNLLIKFRKHDSVSGK